VSPKTVRGLQRAWSAGLALLVALPAGAVLWERLDRRPDWVASAVITATARSAQAARQAESATTARAVHRLASAGPILIEPHARREWSELDRTTVIEARTAYVADRTVVIRAPTSELLLRGEAALERLAGVATSTPRRALRLSDLAFGFVLLSLLLGYATLERSALSDADPFAQQPPLVVLNLLALGALAAGGALAGLQGPRLPLAACLLVACVPPAIWLVRTRVPWRTAALGGRWIATAVASALVAALWVVRFAQP
jgi:hypothetical protein